MAKKLLVKRQKERRKKKKSSSKSATNDFTLQMAEGIAAVTVQNERTHAVLVELVRMFRELISTLDTIHSPSSTIEKQDAQEKLKALKDEVVDKVSRVFIPGLGYVIKKEDKDETLEGGADKG